MTASIRRSASVGFLACLLSLGVVTTAQANPVAGRWVARLPGGAVSSYAFDAGAVSADNSIHGRFTHVYVDDHGVEHTLNGTYVLVPTIGNRGRLRLLFDDGLRIRDVEHAGNGVLQLRHIGLNRIITYYRQ
jgi:hypothetical protein